LVSRLAGLSDAINVDEVAKLEEVGEGGAAAKEED